MTKRAGYCKSMLQTKMKHNFVSDMCQCLETDVAFFYISGRKIFKLFDKVVT